MAQFKIEVTIEAQDAMMANLAKEGVQNILNETREYHDKLIELSDTMVAKDLKTKLFTIINNPIIKMAASKIKF